MRVCVIMCGEGVVVMLYCEGVCCDAGGHSSSVECTAY